MTAPDAIIVRERVADGPTRRFVYHRLSYENCTLSIYCPPQQTNPRLTVV